MRLKYKDVLKNEHRRRVWKVTCLFFHLLKYLFCVQVVLKDKRKQKGDRLAVAEDAEDYCLIETCLSAGEELEPLEKKMRISSEDNLETPQLSVVTSKMFVLFVQVFCYNLRDRFRISEGEI